ncbi:uncharacterized protein [Coffea arabica]|uniref:Uncharacterized protein isoform X2 n=1 Tax=Coffea arabica TaxID=13443 RepID=A0A6P6WV08_COFAR|nr:uncharacterized protein LOC113736472 isoform X2 [Coffea arabica]
MPIFTASLGSVSRTNIAFHSHLFACDITSQNHHHYHHQQQHFSSSITSVNGSRTNPPSVLRFPFFSGCCSAKRAAFFAPKVSVSSDSAAKAVGVDQEQSLSPEDVRQDRRSADWKAARTYNERGLIFEGRVEGFNGGGLLIRFYSLVGFLPFPQLGPSHSCKGDVFQARVGSVEDYGAFLHLRFPDGHYHLTGLVHVSEVSWDLVQDVRDVLSDGDDVRVKIINIDRDKSRITLSIKQLEEDPLLETLEKVMPQDASSSPDYSENSYEIEPLPGLEIIFQELLQEDGIKDVKINRQGFEKRVVSQDLQLWLSNVPPIGDQFTLLARAGRQVQEILLTTSLDQEGIKRALQRVLERVP